MSSWICENKDQQYFFLLQNAHLFPPWAENKMSMKLAILKRFRLPAATFSLDHPWVYTGTDWREISQSYLHPASDERGLLETSIPQMPRLCGEPHCLFPMKDGEAGDDLQTGRWLWLTVLKPRELLAGSREPLHPTGASLRAGNEQ